MKRPPRQRADPRVEAGPTTAPGPLRAARQRALLEAARDARAHAHAPYSKYAVGAAVLDEQGRVHVGCNVENAAHPQGLCAEAGALAAMVVAGGRRAAALLVLTEDAATPCGGCRQRLHEFAGPLTPVLIADPQRIRRRFTLEQLLPHGFGAHAAPAS